MPERYTKDIKLILKGDPELAKLFIGEGRKVLGGLVTDLSFGNKSGARKVTGPNGVKYTASKQMSAQPVVVVDVSESEAKDLIEEIPYLYVSSTGTGAGLRIFDINAKTLVQTITGLTAYEVDSVSANGQIVHMTGNNIALRADLKALTAFGSPLYPSVGLEETVPVSGPSTYELVPGRALVEEGKVSPDGTRYLLSFKNTIELSPGSAIIDGLGGFVLANAETLASLRTAIRMSFRPHASAWALDSQKFFIGASTTVDNGNPPFPTTVAKSTSDYIARFSREGALENTQVVATWAVAPDAGLARKVFSMAATETRLYVGIASEVGVVGDTNKLVVLDITNPAMPIIGTLGYMVGLTHTPKAVSVNHNGTRVFILTGSNLMVEIDVTDDNLSMIGSTSHANFDTAVVNDGLSLRYYKPHKQIPASKAPLPPDERWFFFTKSTATPATVFGYSTDFTGGPVYDFDISAYAPKKRYVLRNAGLRAKR